MKKEIQKLEKKRLKKQDIRWQKHIGKEYVKKDYVEVLNKKINEMETTIKNQRIENEEINKVNKSSNIERKNLHNQIRNLLWQNANLKGDIYDLNGFIKNYLNDNVRLARKQIIQEKSNFYDDVKTKQIQLKNLRVEADLKLKNLENREQKIIKKEEDIKKQQKNLYATYEKLSKYINNFNTWKIDIDNQDEEIKKSWEIVIKTAEKLGIKKQRLQHWENTSKKN